MNSNIYFLPSDSTLDVHEFFKTRGSDAWSFNLFVDELKKNTRGPLSKKQFVEANTCYRKSIRSILIDSRTPRKIQKTLGRQNKKLKNLNFQEFYRQNNSVPSPNLYINVKQSDENVALPTAGAAAEDSHRDTPDASTTFDNDNHASINLDNYTYDDENKYKIDNVNVGELFKKYQLKAAKQIKEKGCFLESDIQELLAMNNNLLIKPGQTSPLISSIFNEACILSIQHEIKQIFGIIDSADIHTDVKVKIEKILKDTKSHTITMTKAAKKLNNVLSDDDYKNYDDIIVIGIRNLLEIIPKYKFNGLINENQVGCSYANPVLSPIFNSPDKRSYLHWSNIKVLESNSKQPDFGGNVLENLNWVGPVLVGEVKGEDRKDDVYMCLMDLFRIGSLSMESINHNKYKGVIGIQVIGMQVTFYISTLLSKSFHVMMEIFSITLPKDLTEIMSYFANVSDMLPVLQYYENSFELMNNLISESHMDTIIDAKKNRMFIKRQKDKMPCCPEPLIVRIPSLSQLLFILFL